jgi:hypothetical protein
LYSALITLPALESITLGTPEVRQADETDLANPESLADLLRVRTVFVERPFRLFVFHTRSLSSNSERIDIMSTTDESNSSGEGKQEQTSDVLTTGNPAGDTRSFDSTGPNAQWVIFL